MIPAPHFASRPRAAVRGAKSSSRASLATYSERCRRLSLIVMLAVSFAGLQGCATTRPDIQLMVANAKTPADHEAIAAYYEQEAARNEAEASSHRALAETYRQFHNSYKNQMAPHCEIMANEYAKIAAEDSALAEEHRKLAQPPK